MKKFFLSVLMLATIGVSAQTVFFQEDFENGGSRPDGWTEEYVSNGNEHLSWTYQNGGTKPAGAYAEPIPSSAHGGNYNAFFYRRSLGYTQETYLVSPTIDLEFAHKPMLVFYYSLMASQLTIEDKADCFTFSLCYRVLDGTSKKWVELKEYSDMTTEMYPWRGDSIYLPDTLCKYRQVQIAFLGKTKVMGLGVCIDDIKIIETQVVNKYIENVYASQPNVNVVPTGSKDNPVLRLRFPVMGNDNKLMLQKLTVNALMQTKDAVPANGVKIYHTTTEYFSTNTLLGTASIVNGKAVFNNINYDLPYGNSYVWVACDVKQDNNHELKGYNIDFSVDANAIAINGINYPSSELNPTGQRTINESILINDFEESIAGWTFTGEFEWSEAKGLGSGSTGAKDPSYAHSGKKMIGTDISGLGTYPGDYELGIEGAGYKAVTPELNCYHYKDISLMFYRWFNVSFGDSATIDVSLDNGTTWNPLWENAVYISERDWSFHKISLGKFADRAPSVKLRFTLGPTGELMHLSGWNIDDVAVVGTFVYVDAAVTAINSPIDDCGLSSAEEVSVTIKNTGYSNISSSYKVSYSLDGKDWVTETVNHPLVRDEEFVYTFSKKADFSALGNHNLTVRVELPDDEYAKNDEVSTVIRSIPYFELPYAEEFEENDGYWRNIGNSTTWQYGRPTGDNISSAYKSNKCWFTKPANGYEANNVVYLESPCFNFSNVQRPMMSFAITGHSIENQDGVAVYYTTDNGRTWTLLPAGVEYSKLHWYNKSTNISALGSSGFSGTFGWTYIEQLLPVELAGKSAVKFRIMFATGAAKTTTQKIENGDGEEDDEYVDVIVPYDGFAIDNFKVFECPVDAGVLAITSPTSDCYLSKQQQISVSIKNYGIRAITPADTLSAAVELGSKVFHQKFFASTNIPVGQSATFTFDTTFNMYDKKTYNIVAYTELYGDTLLFSTINNDQATAQVSVLGEPAYTLGPDIGTLDPATCVVDGGKQSNGSDFVSYVWKCDGAQVSTNRKINGVSFADGTDRKTYTIEVQNSNNCISRDTIVVINSVRNIGVSAVEGLTNNGSICINKLNNEVTVTITNFSNREDLRVGETLGVGYILYDEEGHEQKTVETVQVPGTIGYNQSFRYKFTNKLNFITSGEQKVKFFTVVEADIQYDNDTTTLNMTVNPVPVVNLGSRYWQVADPTTITLDATNDFPCTYVWQDGSTNPTLSITNPASAHYEVRVTDSHNCATVLGQTDIKTDDWQVVEITSPTDICAPESDIAVSFILKNNSANVYSSSTTLKADVIFGTKNFSEQFALPDNVGAYEEIECTLSTTKVDMSSIGAYNIKLTITPNFDIDRTNNQIFETVNLWEVKDVDLGDPIIYTHRADTITLDAGAGWASYSWNGGQSAAQTFTIPSNEDASYYVEVEDIHGCQGSFAQVDIVTTDIYVEEILSPTTSCDIAGISTIKLRIRNNGMSAILPDTELSFKFTIDNGVEQSETFVLTEGLDSCATAIAFFNHNLNLNANYEHSFKIRLDWDEDHFVDNNSLSTQIKQYQHPESFNLGDDMYTSRPDTLHYSLPSGYVNYMWSHGEQTADVTLPYTASTQYWARISNEYGCVSTDTFNIYTHDVALNITEGAVAHCEPFEGETVKGQIVMESLDEIDETTSFIVTFSVNGYTDSKTITAPSISHTEPVDFSFDVPITLPEIGNYQLTTSVEMLGHRDVNLANNNQESEVRVGAYPLPLLDKVKTYNQLSEGYVIDAGPNFVSFDWSVSGEHSQQLTIHETGTYSVTATDNNGCQTTGKTFVFFAEPKFEITDLYQFNDMCSTTDPVSVGFLLANSGNDTLYVGSKIDIAYTIGANATINEQYEVTTDILPKDTIPVVFKTKADFSTANESGYLVNIEASVEGAASVSRPVMIHVWQLPKVELIEVVNDKDGELLTRNVSTLKSSFEMGTSGVFNTYLWSNKSTGQTLTVDKSGTYWVTATNQHGCRAADTVDLHFIPPTVAIIDMKAPNSVCGSIDNQTVSVVIMNNGEKVVDAGTDIHLHYIVDKYADVSEDLTLKSDFVYGASINYDFKNKLTIAESGDYAVKFILTIGDETKDTSIYNLSAYPVPEFTFPHAEIKSKESPYTIEAPKSAVSDVAYLWSTGATSNSISVFGSGKYELTLTTPQGCSFTSSVSFVLENNQGIDDDNISEVQIQMVKLYPVPARNLLNVNLPHQLQGSNLVIMNSAGMVISKIDAAEMVNTIDVSNWAQGVYFLNLENNQGSATFKFIVQ
ncbi:MAG: T9SS type A sorting domain-containing protein [Salinivirgaceae bacterium]|nr:T9SS type A sorting domain-containing protein [Salinivirgaceae bacterium]